MNKILAFMSLIVLVQSLILFRQHSMINNIKNVTQECIDLESGILFDFTSNTVICTKPVPNIRELVQVIKKEKL
jgi:hypothetical protein